MGEPDLEGGSTGMAAAPLVSIVMPVYNAAATLPVTLRSLLLQTYTNWELLVIDDGSRDATLEIAGARADPRIRIVEGPGNLGPSARRNQGIALARGSYVALMDSDDIAYPERLATQVKFMLEHADCDLLGCATLIFDSGGAVYGRFPPCATHEEVCARPWVGFPLPNSSWMGKRAWFEKYPYYAGYRRAEDYDVLLRSCRHSRFACLAQVLLGYRQDGRSLKKLLSGRFYTSRAIARAARRQGAWGSGLAGLAVQGAKALADVLTVPFGWDGRLRGDSDASLTAAEAQQWQAVWRAVNQEQVAGISDIVSG